MGKKIIFNYLPPASKDLPSSAFSILKSFLSKNNYESNIIYWNWLLDNILGKAESNSLLKGIDYRREQDILLPFLLFLAEKYNDEIVYTRIMKYFDEQNSNNLIGENLIREVNFNKKNLIKTKNMIIERINYELNKIDFKEILLWGIGGKYFQWIPGYLLSMEIKKRDPEAQIVVGGFGNKEEAFEILNSCRYFDYAIYGEGEYPLLDLCRSINKGILKLNEIPRLIYKKNNEIKISKTYKSNYLDFNNYILPDYTDYLDYIKDIPEDLKKSKIQFPINTIRSCWWKKCKFCNYNSGYKYRERNPDSIINEIELITDKFNPDYINFVDNDTIGRNIKKFEILLDALIESNLKNDMKYNFWAEIIISRGLNGSLYKKMYLAGFKRIFAGFEAVSDRILKKMNKFNGFAENILFLKFCTKFNFEIAINIITNIPDETDDDIVDSRRNMHYLRFFFHQDYFKFSFGNLLLYKEAKYYKEMSKNERKKYKPEALFDFLPSNFVLDPFNVFSHRNDKFLNESELKIFTDVENYYKSHKFDYKILKNNDSYFYFEYLDNNLLTSIKIDYLEFNILYLLNDSVLSIEELQSLILKFNISITKDRLFEILHDFKNQYFVYYNEDYSSIVSVLDTDLVF